VLRKHAVPTGQAAFPTLLHCELTPNITGPVGLTVGITVGITVVGTVIAVQSQPIHMKKERKF
jgi:Na+/H+ antiporter NhaB